MLCYRLVIVLGTMKTDSNLYLLSTMHSLSILNNINQLSILLLQHQYMYIYIYILQQCYHTTYSPAVVQYGRNQGLHAIQVPGRMDVQIPYSIADRTRHAWPVNIMSGANFSIWTGRDQFGSRRRLTAKKASSMMIIIIIGGTNILGPFYIHPDCLALLVIIACVLIVLPQKDIGGGGAQRP